MDALINKILQRFDVRGSGIRTIARRLSGGNQQRFVLGRELSGHPPAVVADNPTRGLDVAAMESIHAQRRAARNAGSAVIIYSWDLDEVLALADRVVVVHGGTISEVNSGRDTIGRAMLGLE